MVFELLLLHYPAGGQGGRRLGAAATQSEREHARACAESSEMAGNTHTHIQTRREGGIVEGAEVGRAWVSLSPLVAPFLVPAAAAAENTNVMESVGLKRWGKRAKEPKEKNNWERRPVLALAHPSKEGW